MNDLFRKIFALSWLIRYLPITRQVDQVWVSFIKIFTSGNFQCVVFDITPKKFFDGSAAMYLHGHFWSIAISADLLLPIFLCLIFTCCIFTILENEITFSHPMECFINQMLSVSHRKTILRRLHGRRRKPGGGEPVRCLQERDRQHVQATRLLLGQGQRTVRPTWQVCP